MSNLDERPSADGDALPAVVWKSVTELAAMRGVTPAAIYRRVERLETEGLLATRRVNGRRLVDVAAFEFAIGEVEAVDDDEAGGIRLRSAVKKKKPDTLYQAKVRKLELETRVLALNLAERQAQLVSVEAVTDAMVKAGEAIVRAIERLPSYAPELMVVARDGEPGLRKRLREIKDHLRRSAGEALAVLAAEGRAQEEAGGTVVDIAEPAVDRP